MTVKELHDIATEVILRRKQEEEERRRQAEDEKRRKLAEKLRPDIERVMEMAERRAKEGLLFYLVTEIYESDYASDSMSLCLFSYAPSISKLKGYAAELAQALKDHGFVVSIKEDCVINFLREKEPRFFLQVNW